MAAPTSFKLAKYANGLFSPSFDFRELQLGDSMTTEGNSVTSIPLGKARMLRRYSNSVGYGSCHRGSGVGPSGSLGSPVSPSATYIDTPLSSANYTNGTGTSREPYDEDNVGATTCADGSIQHSPNLMLDFRVTGNPADGSTLYRIDFGGWSAGNFDLDNWANGNPWAGEVTCRFLYHSKSTNNGSGSLKIQGRRNSAAVGAASSFSLETAEGIAYKDIVVAAGTNHPGLVIQSTAGDDTGLHLHCEGAACWASSSGVRTPGYFQSYIACGSYTPAEVLQLIGGGAAPRCLDLYVRNFLQYGALMPNRICHWYGQNATAAETADYAGGGYSVFKTNCAAVIDKMDAHMAALGITDHLHLLVSGYEAGTAAYNALRSQAMYELAKERPNVSMASIHNIMPYNPFPSASPNRWDLHTDNVHPRSVGSCLAYIALYAMMRAAVDAEVYEPRAARMLLRMGL